MWISGISKELVKLVRLSVFLDRCKLCEADLVMADEDVICRACSKNISLAAAALAAAVCEWCGRPLGNSSSQCGECIVNPPPFRLHVSYGEYRDELRELILRYKYGGVEKLKYLLAAYYVEIFEKRVVDTGTFDFILPVPPDRGRKRVFNPILEPAKILSRRYGIPLLGNHLVKHKETLPQAGLSRSKRLTNLDGAFKLAASPSLKEKKVILVDDVYTTGTTIKKCTELLNGQGAEVTALTLARSV